MIDSFALLLVVATIAQAPRSDAGESKDDQALSRLERTWNEAHLKGDVEALAQLWANDLVVTVPKMAPMTKAQSLAIWKSGKFKFERYQSSDLRIKVYGDAAVVTGRLQRTRTVGERKMEDDWLFTKVYVRAIDSWQVVVFHASVAPERK